MLPKQMLQATNAPSVRQFSITFANVWQQNRSKTAGQSTVVFRENILLPRFPLFVNGSRLKRNLNDPQSHEYTRGQKLRSAFWESKFLYTKLRGPSHGIFIYW